jgi:16S rRNA (cytidine1402-2'-O)-methyltransferase
MNTGTLYLVATPIGNLEDITHRALKILGTVKAIAAEDTRHTGKLLHHFGIETPQISYHEHSQQQRLQEIVDRLERGEAIALVSDAGMPSISDPGYDLVRACLDRGIDVVPIPGATAAIAALAASGLPTDRFVFEGFIPTKNKERKSRLGSIAASTQTIVLYEAPHRLLATLKDLREVLEGERKIVLARELTKIYEEFWRGSLEEAVELYENKREAKGEYTVVIAGKIENSGLDISETAIKEELEKLLAEGLSRSQASRQLAELTSLSRRQIYQLALEL